MTGTSTTKPTAFISGVGRRLGHFLATQLLAKGYRVLGHYRTQMAELESLQAAGAELFQADFTDTEQVVALTEWVTSQTTQLDLLLHNASAFGEPPEALLAKLQQFDQFYQVHMRTPVQLTDAFTPLLKAAKHPSVIAITDIYVGHPNPKLATYCATKAGLDNLCQSYARSLAPDVRVNTIEPGPIMFLDSHPDAYKEKILAKTPLASEGGFLPIWQALSMLIDNHYMTGARVQVDGGRSVAEL
ncbi:SDR family oxidoreductase [Corallincola platygyrae]|uniref:SDR family oxidoreductase n=1 Tax=Corallincola platygyrae TaxID=1193278 RepID=A0ABW4XNG5_9GAMM